MIPPIALQLYTLREQLANDFLGVMKNVAEIGFVGVETAFFPDHIAFADAAKIIKNFGLEISAVHCEIPLNDQQAPVLAQADALGCEYLVWHGWPQDSDYSTVAGVKRLAERYNQANNVAMAHGYRFGIHNHWWEFEAVEGHYPYQILLDYMDEYIFFELDTYWAKTAGVDPVQVVKDLGTRIPLLHYKDGPAKKGHPMLAAGQGVMDFAAISQAANSNTNWIIVEMDECATDTLEAVRESYRHLTETGLAQGKR